MSIISASSFGTATVIARVCFPAFFLEITFLGLAVGFLTSLSWIGDGSGSVGASFSSSLEFSLPTAAGLVSVC
jgi:hypothetical protein